MNKFVDVLWWVVAFLCVAIFPFMLWINPNNLPVVDNVGNKYDVYRIFQKVVAQTGQIQDRPILVISNDNTVNAATDGKFIWINRGLLDYAQNEDEVALVIGHELAHIMLRHTSAERTNFDDVETQISEANADKMGGFYIMKAGYDICKAREFWKRLRLEKGNYLGLDHPNFSYRYDELGVNCEK